MGGVDVDVGGVVAHPVKQCSPDHRPRRVTQSWESRPCRDGGCSGGDDCRGGVGRRTDQRQKV